MGTELAYSSKIMADSEEGELSDSASVEEISEEDFKKEDVKDGKLSSPKVTKDSRVWTMSDLCKYQMRGGYVSSLYNLAWAQAVQNKPLNNVFVEVEREENKNDNNHSKRSSPSSSVASVDSCSSKTGKKRKVEEVVIVDSGDEGDVMVLEDVEKEEGELEEGEIDLDMDVVGEKTAGENGCNDDDGMMSLNGLKSEELEMKVKFIRGALESVTVMEVEKSFQEVCSKLHSALESLWELFQETDVPTKTALSLLAFTAVGVVNTVFSSLNHLLKEKNKDSFSRLLALVNNHDYHLFSLEKMREISVMVSSLHSCDGLSTMTYGVKENEITGKTNVNCASAETAAHDMNTTIELPVTESLVQNRLNASLEAPKAGLSNFRSRGLMLPLLDLHKDHDLDSLPSPTRETTPSLPVHRVLAGGDETIKSGLPTAKVAPDASQPRMHPYQTDAFKAFSSYQQKFGVGSLFSSDLHSPTPSEDSNDRDGDTAVEVSSSSIVNSLRSVDRVTVGQQIPPPLPDNSISHGAIPVKNHAPIISGSISNVKASAKSRDPRLRFVNNDASTLNHGQRAVPMANNASKREPIYLIRKQKILEDPADGHAVKRQRSRWESPAVNVTRSGGWLEDIDMVAPQTVTQNQLSENVECDPRNKDNRETYTGILAGSVSGTGTSNLPNNINKEIPVRGASPITISEPVPVMSNTAAALPDLLKDIAINPTILINLLKMGQQQRLALDSQSKVTEPANPTVGVPAVANAIPAPFSEIFSKPTGKPQVPSQAGPIDELGKVRMKSRDPRRILHNNTLQRGGSVGSKQLKTDITSPSTSNGSQDFQNLNKQDFKADGKTVPPQSLLAPGISLQFTKSLKNIANIVSVSQASSTQPFVAKNLAVSMQNKSDKVDSQSARPNSGNQTGAGITSASAPETAAVGAHSQNAWGDVEHLFEGYDDKQKAAIQRERSRRIEEQRKLFAARKLCLVLDLDHTLLNSAKFMEVDPMHDEMLRKKEEQDREKPYRHLYRFPHMGMWTKLRPGIWNFLERVSKLFELHLYTMGNKLYATEMAKVLDPTGVLFSGRVISRGDDGDPFDSDDRVPKTKDLEGVLGMESGVVIIDDSVRVWPHNKLNLIVVERYIYFPCSRRQFGLPGPSLLEIDHDERSEDGTLASSLAVIERLHQNFFSHQALDEVDVRNILASEQRKILGGCRILFSRVFPVGESNPHLHPLWQTAEQFGAVCVNQIDEQVTHVVANSLGTDKVNWALSTGRFVVHPGWVEASALLYRRAREQDFAIKP